MDDTPPKMVAIRTFPWRQRKEVPEEVVNRHPIAWMSWMVFGLLCDLLGFVCLIVGIVVVLRWSWS